MNYVRILQDNHINAGECIPNLSRLRKDLLRTESCSEVEFIKLAKLIFDNNLPNDYNKLVASSGMCYYWAIVYKELFENLGYRVTLMEIGGVSFYIHSHIWVRIELDSKFIELDRDNVRISDISKGSSFEHGTSAKFIQDMKCTPKVNEFKMLSLEEWSKFTLLELPEGVLDSLSLYVDNLTSGDITGLELPDLKDYFTGFMLMYVYATDNKYARDIRDLVNEKKARQKYKVPLFK